MKLGEVFGFTEEERANATKILGRLRQVVAESTGSNGELIVATRAFVLYVVLGLASAEGSPGPGVVKALLIDGLDEQLESARKHVGPGLLAAKVQGKPS